MHAQLEELRETVADYLRNRGDFQGVTILTRRNGDIINAIKTAIGSVGVAVEVYLKSCRISQSQTQSVQFDPVVIGLSICEDVLINQDAQTGTRKTAFFLLEAAVVALKQWPAPGFGNVIMPDERGFQYGHSNQVSDSTLILLQDFSTNLNLAARTP